MIGGSIARRYARALVEIAKEEGKVQEICDEIIELNDLFKNEPELIETFSSPVYKIAEKDKLFVKIADSAGVSTTVSNFVRLLIGRGRMVIFDSITLSVRDLSDLALSRVRAQVTVPMPLEDEALSKIKSTITKMTGKDVILETRHEPAIIGGIVARIGNTIYDYSIKNELKNLREKMEGDV